MKTKNLRKSFIFEKNTIQKKGRRSYSGQKVSPNNPLEKKQSEGKRKKRNFIHSKILYRAYRFLNFHNSFWSYETDTEAAENC